MNAVNQQQQQILETRQFKFVLLVECYMYTTLQILLITVEERKRKKLKSGRLQQQKTIGKKRT